MDSSGVAYGDVHVERNDDGLVRAEFTPAPAYEQIRPLFEELEEIVNEQAFSVLDEVCDRIAALGLGVRSQEGFMDIEDVQIHGRKMSFRIPPGAQASP